mgnify:CR=1 FL=1
MIKINIECFNPIATHSTFFTRSFVFDKISFFNIDFKLLSFHSRFSFGLYGLKHLIKFTVKINLLSFHFFAEKWVTLFSALKSCRYFYLFTFLNLWYNNFCSYCGVLTLFPWLVNATFVITIDFDINDFILFNITHFRCWNMNHVYWTFI